VVGVDPDDMSEDAFVGVLEGARSPALPEARESYRLLAKSDVSIAFLLAIFHHESQYGHEGITPKYGTKNPGNCRSARLGGGVAIPTEKGPFVRYNRWIDGWADLAFRLIDPAYVYVKEGRTTIREVITRFAPASDGNSPESYINAVVADMNRWVGVVPPMTAQIPGFKWTPADSDHYDKGRSQQIRGGAQHYTAGTNSLSWLTKTSRPEVSATFLVKHNPTLEDRGWQLVRIEDTAWTTAKANPYTVSIEYEHDGKQPIPDIAYEALAQTWVDIDRYVRGHNLGAIEKVLGHKEWVGNPSLICPDGIDILRIQRRFQELKNPPKPETIELNGYKIVQGFKGFWEELAGYEPTLPYRVLGLPTEDEWSPEPGIAYQRFERGVLAWKQHEPAPWHIHLKRRDEAI
jgi:hypothetical protein